MKCKLHVKPVPEINMIPMIDVIMMLLIFFLVATQMKKVEDGGEVTLPDSVQAAMDVLKETGLLTVSILSRSDDGKPYNVEGATMGGEELTRLLQLGARAERDLRGQDAVVRIRADRDAQLSQVQGVLIACQKAKIVKVFIAADAPKQ